MFCQTLGQRIRRLMYPERTKVLPLSIILVVFVVALTSDWMSTMQSSFIPKLVQWFGVSSVSVGFNVGIVDSTMSIGSFISSLLWGYLSDKKGKRWCILATSICCVVTALGFGFSQGLWWAVVMKFLQGCSVGQVVVLKGLLKEVCDETNIALGMSVLLTAPAMGSIIGPSVGGYTAFPHQLYPKVFTRGNVFAQFPALLPNLIIATGIGVGIALTLLFLPKDGRQKNSSCEEGNCLGQVGLYGSIGNNNTTNNKTIDARSNSNTYKIKDNKSDSNENENDNNNDGKNISNMKNNCNKNDTKYVNSNENRSIEKEDRKNSNTPNKTTITNIITYSNNNKTKLSVCSRIYTSLKQSGMMKVLQTKECLLCCVLLVLFASSEIGFKEMLPVLASTDPKYKGMGLEPSELGLLLTVVSSVQIVFQLTLIPKLSTYFGPQRFFILSSVIQAILCPLVPAFALLHNRTLMWVALVVVIFVLNSSVFAGYLSIDILINNSVSVDVIGSALGVTMTASHLGRFFARIMFGGIYSWSLGNIKGVPGNIKALGFPFDQFLAFFLMSLLSVICAVVTSKFPTQKKDVGNEK